MKDLYEYLSRSGIITKKNYNKNNRFWIKAITDVTISGDFETSNDGISWINESSYKLPRGSSIYLYTPKRPSILNYSGKFNIGGDILGLISKNCNKHDVDLNSKPLKDAFRNSDVIDASQLDLLQYGIHDECYHAMFEDCTSLTTAPDLLMTDLAYECYQLMFSGCTSLTTAPKLPATRLAEACYGGMFIGCTSLKTAPKLPATRLAERCYMFMFSNCTSLTQAPDLPAKDLLEDCYHSMFEDCSSLTTAPNSSVDLNDTRCCLNMFKNTKVII